MLKKLCGLIVLFLIATPAWGITARAPKAKKKHHFPHLHWPWHKPWVMFPPSRDSLRAQNALIDQLGLERITDDRELSRLIEEEKLVPITTNSYVTVSPAVPSERAYVRPFTDEFLQQLGKDFYTQFSRPITVNSAVRPITVQKKLRRWNPNAAPIKGDLASSHMAGATVDLARKDLTLPQIRFLELRLLQMEAFRTILVEEEIVEPCFHIMVGPQRFLETESSPISDELVEQQ